MPAPRLESDCYKSLILQSCESDDIPKYAQIVFHLIRPHLYKDPQVDAKNMHIQIASKLKHLHLFNCSNLSLCIRAINFNYFGRFLFYFNLEKQTKQHVDTYAYIAVLLNRPEVLAHCLMNGVTITGALLYMAKIRKLDNIYDIIQCYVPDCKMPSDTSPMFESFHDCYYYPKDVRCVNAMFCLNSKTALMSGKDVINNIAHHLSNIFICHEQHRLLHDDNFEVATMITDFYHEIGYKSLSLNFVSAPELKANEIEWIKRHNRLDDHEQVYHLKDYAQVNKYNNMFISRREIPECGDHVYNSNDKSCTSCAWAVKVFDEINRDRNYDLFVLACKCTVPSAIVMFEACAIFGIRFNLEDVIDVSLPIWQEIVPQFELFKTLVKRGSDLIDDLIGKHALDDDFVEILINHNFYDFVIMSKKWTNSELIRFIRRFSLRRNLKFVQSYFERFGQNKIIELMIDKEVLNYIRLMDDDDACIDDIIQLVLRGSYNAGIDCQALMSHHHDKIVHKLLELSRGVLSERAHSEIGHYLRTCNLK